MKKFKYLYIGVLSAILSGTFTSCEDYLDAVSYTHLNEFIKMCPCFDVRNEFR